MAGCIFWLTAALQFLSRSPISKTVRLTQKLLTEKCFGRQPRLNDLYWFLHALADLPNRKRASNEAQQAVQWHPISRSYLNNLLKKARDAPLARRNASIWKFFIHFQSNFICNPSHTANTWENRIKVMHLSGAKGASRGDIG